MTFPVSKQVRARNNISPRPYVLLEEAEPTTMVPVTPVRRQVWEPGSLHRIQLASGTLGGSERGDISSSCWNHWKYNISLWGLPGHLACESLNEQHSWAE